MRFYKAAANTGTHVGTPVDATGGTLLAEATFSGETASGWQARDVRARRCAITAGTTYVATYLAPNGHYSVTGAAFASSPFDNPPLHALANADEPERRLRLQRARRSSRPARWNATNYWVDVLFAPGSSMIACARLCARSRLRRSPVAA